MIEQIKQAYELAKEKFKEIDSVFIIITGTEQGGKDGLVSCADGFLQRALLVEALTNEDFRKIVVKLGAKLADEDKVAQYRKVLNEKTGKIN